MASSDVLSIDSTITLNDGIKIPNLGLGVFQSKPGPETYNAVLHAIKSGYRSVDTAALYKNEVDVGRAVRDSEVERERIFVTTKLWYDHHGKDKAIQAFHDSLKRLDLKYIDLYLMHSPRGGKLLETWEAFVELKSQGLVRSIGVSNFGIHHLEEIKLHFPKSPPSVNQVEVSPYMTRNELVEYCKSNGIVIQAYSPLTKRVKLEDPPLVVIAKKYSKSTAQVLIRWSLQRGYVVLPKSANEGRIEGNAQVYDFSITEEDMTELDTYNINLVTDWDPTVDPL
eukprot:TRINITY_DN23350_c0_g1_i1.p1 TRINITY_DN23350_c0_g1~~TRINITY_DN23350_c0_g1_i1.p1  ORF type:complete len:291 (+),score=43.73 TRINITY_DN23350_c0_g1_i1:28-873(+)